MADKNMMTPEKELEYCKNLLKRRFGVEIVGENPILYLTLTSLCDELIKVHPLLSHLPKPEGGLF